MSLRENHDRRKKSLTISVEIPVVKERRAGVLLDNVIGGSSKRAGGQQSRQQNSGGRRRGGHCFQWSKKKRMCGL